MADNAAKDAAPKTDSAAEVKPEKVKKKKLRPTNCAQSNKRIRRKDWYYRDGKYFANKQCYKLFAADALKKKAAEEAKAKEDAKPKTEEKASG